MAQSRRDKKRSKNLQNFKNKQIKKNVMAKKPEMRPFRQIPTWQAEDEFTVQGTELEALYNYFNIVAPAFTALQQVFARGVQSNKIKIGYEYEDGSPVADEDLKLYTAKLNDYFQEKLKEEEVQPVVEESAESTPTATILNMHGAPVTNES
jgi:hypothetical protein